MSITSPRAQKCIVRERSADARYYNEARTHLSLAKDAPISRPIERFGRVIAEPMVGDLHHRYARI
jgi:hypothetical protein